MVPRPSRTRSNARRARRGGFQGKLRPPEGLESRQLLNADPVLLADAFEVQQNSVWQDLDLLANDEFPDDYTGSRLIGAVSYGSEGGAIRIIDGGQRVSYSPAPDFTGSESFSYFVSGITQTVVVSVVAPLTDDYYEILPGPESHVLDVSANDTYWDDYDGLRQITSISHSDLGGEVEIAPDGRSLIYTPPELEFGKDQIIYVVDGRYPARVTIEIPDPLESDRFEMLEDAGPTTLDVLANDPFWVNYEGTRAITRLLPGENNTGTIAISADGRSISYTPAPDFYGAESFRYVVDESYEASVTVRVHHPVQDDFLRVDENSTAYEIFVLGNDYYFNFDHEMVRVVESITSVGPTDAGGVVTISADGRTLKYTPPENYVGTDTFTYIADGKYTARVRMNVERPVRDDWFDVYQNHVGIRLDVLTNDFLGNGYAGPRQITSVSATEAGGEISIAPDGKSIVYTPVAEYVGSDAFTYIVDGDLEASVFLDVRPIQVSHSKHLCVMPDSLVFAFDPISGTEAFGPYYPGARAITSVTQPEAGGEVRIVDGHRLELTVDIARSYVFEATVDGRYPVHVRVDVGHHLTNDHSVVDQNSAENSIDVLANDFTTRYCDGHRVTYNGSKMITSVSETAEGGQIAIAPDGKSIIYTPPADFSGTDTFTYIVDGHMEATGSIEVIRRVRDDVYRVDPDSTPTDLPLLANDGFGTDYFGAREITRVGTPEHGGQIAIAADGKSISYTPVPGFVGTDTFLYYVDDQLIGNVTVVVDDNTAAQLSQWESWDGFAQELLEAALQRYAGLFGQQGSPIVSQDYTTFDGAVPGAETADRSHSETNVQVAGVDEADLIELDSDYVYSLRGGELIISQAWPADQLQVVSRMPFQGQAIGQYLFGDRVAVVSQSYRQSPWLYDDVFGRVVGLDYYWYPTDAETYVTIFDVSDRHAPTLVSETRLDGAYTQSRSIDGNVYLVLRENEFYLPAPELIIEEMPEPIDPAAPYTMLPTGRYETRDAYVARLNQLIGEMLPKYETFGGEGQLLETGVLVEPEGIVLPQSDAATSLVSVLSINMLADQPTLAEAVAVMASGADEIYGSLEHLYVFDTIMAFDNEPSTAILKFAWNDTSVEFVSQGIVPGRLHDQFAADENDGYLRMAMDVSNSWSGTWTNRSETDLLVISDFGGLLAPVSSVFNLGVDQTIRSARFMGDSAYIVTFRNVDPLLAMDLSDPNAPQMMGHVTLPGFSEYIHPVGDHHLLTVGISSAGGRSGPVQISLFDVSDLALPALVDQYTFSRFSGTEANWDHHAFGYYAEHGVLAIPLYQYFVERVDNDGDGYRESRQTTRRNELTIFEVNVDANTSDAIQLRGAVEHDSAVRRSGFIDNVLYSLADDELVATPIDDPASVIARVSLVPEEDPNENPTLPDSATIPEVIAGLADRARDQLRRQRGADTKQMVLTHSISNSDGSSGTNVELRDADDRYLLHADANGTTTLLGMAPVGQEIVIRHNLSMPYDVDGNGKLGVLDVIRVINQLDREQGRTVGEQPTVNYWDVNADGSATPLDVVYVIAELDRQLALLAGDASPSTPLAVGSVSATGLVSPVTANSSQGQTDDDETESDATHVVRDIVYGNWNEQDDDPFFESPPPHSPSRVSSTIARPGDGQHGNERSTRRSDPGRMDDGLAWHPDST